MLCVLAVGAIVATARAGADQSVAPSPSAMPSPAASEVATSHLFRMSVVPTPVSSMSPLRIAPAEMRQLVNEYMKAQKSEYRALQHRQDLESKELRTSQQARLTEWKSTMNKKRETFFKEHSNPDERRSFMEDRNNQYNTFVKMLHDEKIQREADAKIRLKSLLHDQGDHLKEFKDYLSRGERPPKTLWPQPGS